MEERRFGGIRAAALVLAAVAACGVLPACVDGPPPDVTSAFTRAQAAFARGDAEALCRMLSPDGRLAVGSSAHETRPIDCPQDISKFIASMHPYRAGPRPQIAVAKALGDDDAIAEVSTPGGRTATLPFAKTRGGWRLDALYDASLSSLQAVGYPEYDSLAVDTIPDEPDAGSATVRDATASGRPPCPPVRADADEFPVVSGGCLLRVTTDEVPMSVWGPFGVLPYGDCTVRYSVRVDGSGRAWIVDFRIDGSNPCVDTVQCLDDASQKAPWAATVDRSDDGRLLLRIPDACLDTCIGRFRGAWDMEMTETARGWRLRFPPSLGTTGWRVDGAVTSNEKPIIVDD